MICIALHAIGDSLLSFFVVLLLLASLLHQHKRFLLSQTPIMRPQPTKGNKNAGVLGSTWSKGLIFIALIVLILRITRGNDNVDCKTTASSLLASMEGRSSFFPAAKYFDVFDENDAAKIARHYENLIVKYKDELKVQYKRATTFWEDKPGMDRCKGRIGTIEAVMLYIMIREEQPTHVLEIGALCGASTRWILEALEANGKGKLSTFDLHDYSKEYMEERHTTEGRWDMYTQDIFEYLKTGKGRQIQKEIDLFFIDALHRNAFAQIYTRQLLANHPHRVSVFVHDIYVPFLIPPYKECQKDLSINTFKVEIECVKRKAKEITASDLYKNMDIFYGPTQPGGEGSELISWLARTGRSNGLITFSPYAATAFAELIFSALKRNGFPVGSVNNPSIFFELNPL